MFSEKEYTHFSYLEDTLRVRPSHDPSYFEKCINVMKEYEQKGDVWWLKNKDPAELSRRQIDEKILLIPLQIFKSGLSLVLGREVEEKEISFKNNAFIAEFKEKFKSYTPTDQTA